MTYVRLAALCLLLLGVLPVVFVTLGIGAPSGAHLVRLCVQGAIAGGVGVMLLQRRPGAWHAALIFAALMSVLGLLVLSASRLGELWLLTSAPRQVVMVQATFAALAVAAFNLLVLPSARRAYRGVAPLRGTVSIFEPLCVLLAIGIVGYLAVTALQRYPRLVIDEANLLSATERERIAVFHGLLRNDYGIDYRVLIDPDVDDIERVAAERYQDLDVGSAGRRGRGLLLLLDPVRDRVRLEVGYALEAVFVDGFVAYVEQRQMVEFFEVGRIADGILATTEMIVMRADNAQTGAGLDGEVWVAGSGGGGASANARIGLGGAPTSTVQLDAADADADMPRDVLRRYQSAMAARNDNPNLSIYSQETQNMMVDWVTTGGQMDNVARSLAGCPIERELHAANGDRAVLRSPIAMRSCPPYFFVRENGRWKLDLAPMSTALRFGRSNKWRLSTEDLGPYAFGFADLHLDRNGYPLAQTGG